MLLNDLDDINQVTANREAIKWEDLPVQQTS